MWVTDTSTEVLRVTVPNMTCHGVCFMTDGHSIISGKYNERYFHILFRSSVCLLRNMEKAGER